MVLPLSGRWTGTEVAWTKAAVLPPSMTLPDRVAASLACDAMTEAVRAGDRPPDVIEQPGAPRILEQQRPVEAEEFALVAAKGGYLDVRRARRLHAGEHAGPNTANNKLQRHVVTLHVRKT
jgi:hypothetical protein